MALAGAGRAEEERVLALGDEARGGELVDEGAVHLVVEVEVEVVEGRSVVAERGLLDAALEEAVLTAQQLVGDERRQQVDGSHLLGLGLPEPGFQDVGHAGEAQLAQGVIEFDEVHVWSPVLCSMRSR